MERCDIKTGSAVCGQPASNWCYQTSGEAHNHNVCDDHWDARKKACRQPDAKAAEAPAKAAPQKGSGRDGAPPPVRKI